MARRPTRNPHRCRRWRAHPRVSLRSSDAALRCRHKVMPFGLKDGVGVDLCPRAGSPHRDTLAARSSSDVTPLSSSATMWIMLAYIDRETAHHGELLPLEAAGAACRPDCTVSASASARSASPVAMRPMFLDRSAGDLGGRREAVHVVVDDFGQTAAHRVVGPRRCRRWRSKAAPARRRAPRWPEALRQDKSA